MDMACFPFSWWWTFGWFPVSGRLKLLYSCGITNSISFLLGKYLGVKLLGYSVKVCLTLYATEKSLIKGFVKPHEEEGSSVTIPFPSHHKGSVQSRRDS